MHRYLSADNNAAGRPQPCLPFTQAVPALQGALRAALLLFCAAATLPTAWAQTAAAAPATASTAPAIGRVLLATGTVTLQPAGGSPRLASADTDLQVGDVVQTQASSTAALRYSDGTSVQLGQLSRMAITDFIVKPEQASEERFVMRLFTGALRVITGAIGKRRPNSVRFNTATATVGIRGTDFVVRQCAADCPVNDNPALSRASEDPAGRLAASSGTLVATSARGVSRTLAATQPFVQGDSLRTEAGTALLVLQDGTRIALDPNSELLVRTLEYSDTRPEQGRMELVLVQGKAQLITGRLAGLRPAQFIFVAGEAAVRVNTTAFGVALQNQPTNQPTNQRTEVFVRQGDAVVTETTPGSSPNRLEAGKGITLQPGAPAQASGEIAFVAPAPQLADVDTALLFGPPAAAPGAAPLPGTYVHVNEGAVVLLQDGRELVLLPSETGFANDGQNVLRRVNAGARIAGVNVLGLQVAAGPMCRAE